MSSPASGSLRGLRVAAFAVAGTLLAAAAHVAGGGRLPSASSVVLASVIPAVGGLWLSRRRRDWLSIAAVLGGVQVVLHTWLMSASATSTCLIHGGGHSVHAAAAVVGCPTTDGMPQMSLTSSGLGAPAGSLPGWHLAEGSTAMLLAHTVAVALTAVVLAAGERAVWQLMQWLRPALRVVRADLPILPGRRCTALVTTAPVRWRSSADLSGPGRRGPPVFLNAR
jgi:hypothetical protein